MLKQHTAKSHPSFTKATCMFAIGGHPNLAAHSSLIHHESPCDGRLYPKGASCFCCSDKGTGEAIHSYPLI